VSFKVPPLHVYDLILLKLERTSPAS